MPRLRGKQFQIALNHSISLPGADYFRIRQRIFHFPMYSKLLLLGVGGGAFLITKCQKTFCPVHTQNSGALDWGGGPDFTCRI